MCSLYEAVQKFDSGTPREQWSRQKKDFKASDDLTNRLDVVTGTLKPSHFPSETRFEIGSSILNLLFNEGNDSLPIYLLPSNYLTCFVW